MSTRGMLGLMPHTRRGLVVFWTALFMLSVALQYAAAASPKSALATQTECFSFAIFTTDVNGTNNENHYASKPEVYLNGGPGPSGQLPEDTVIYYRVEEPDGTPLSEIRQTTADADGKFFVQLAPFDTTTNPGNEYSVTASQRADLKPGDCTKNDNFKVDGPGTLKVTKAVEGGQSGASFPFSVDCGIAGDFSGSVVSGGAVTFEVDNLAVCKVTEGTLPAPPAGYTWGAPTYTGNPGTVHTDATTTIGIVNHLNLIPAPAITITKGVSASASGPFEDEITVATGTTVYYRIVITNTGNVTLSGVELTDSIYDLGDVCADPIPTSLAAGAHYTCNYSVHITESGTIHNVAKVSTEQTDDKTADATVNASTAPTLTIDKTNNAPLVIGLPTAKAGDTVTFTLAYTHTGDPADNGVIKDVLPNGLTYVTGSATNSAEFTFDGYNSATRTLTWLADEVDANGSVTYRATVDAGAAALPQPLKNVATIDSDDTSPDTDDSQVFVAPPPQAETSVPSAPRSDIASAPNNTTSGGSMLLVLLALAGIALAVVFVAPTPAAIRKRMKR